MDSAKGEKTSYLEARVSVWWLPGHALWWNTELLGTTAQLAAALEELAVRVTVDSLARQVLSTDSFSVIGYGPCATTATPSCCASYPNGCGPTPQKSAARTSAILAPVTTTPPSVEHTRSTRAVHLLAHRAVRANTASHNGIR